MSAGNLNIGNNVPNNPIGLQEFRSFVFGKDSPYDNTVIRLTPGGDGHTLCTTHRDFVGNFLRRQETKDLNNNIRVAFYQAVSNAYGGADNIPERVKAAMNLVGGDYATGKPLTARRIRATITTVIADKFKVDIQVVKDLKATGMDPELLLGTKLDVKDLLNPAVLRQLKKDPGLCETLASLDEKQLGCVKRAIRRGGPTPIPLGTFAFRNDSKINSVVQRSFNDIFEKYDTKTGDYTEENLLGVATADIFRGLKITKNEDEKAKNDKTNEVQSPGNGKITNDKDVKGGKSFLLKDVFDNNEKDVMDILPLFNQGSLFFINGNEEGKSLAKAFGFGKGDACFLQTENHREAHFDIKRNNDGSYHVTLDMTSNVDGVLIGDTQGSGYIGIDNEKGNAVNLKVEMDLRRVGPQKSFRVCNTKADVKVVLQPDKKSNMYWQ